MRKLKYFGIAIAVILVILLVVPFFISLNGFKGQITQGFKQVTGRELVINGDITLAIIPRPTVKVTEVIVLAPPSATDKNFMEVKSISASLAVGKLLQGVVSFSSININSPIFNLEMLKSGKGTWELDTPEKIGKTEEKSNMNLPFSSVSIYDGIVKYRKGKDLTLVEGINTEISTKAISDGMNFGVQLNLNAIPISVKGNAGKLGDVIPLMFEVKVLGEAVNFDGEINTVSSSLKGSAKATGKLTKFVPNLPKELQNEFNLASEITLTSSSAELEKFTLSFGKVKGQGRGRFDMEKKTANLNLAIQPGNIDVVITSDDFTSPDAGKLKINAKNLKELFTVLAVDTKGMPDFIEKEFIFSTAGSYTGDIINLKNMDFRAGDATFGGKIAIKTKDSNKEFEYDLNTNNAKPLAKLFGMQLPVSINNARVTGITKHDGNKVQTDTNLYSAWAETNVSGFVELSNAQKAVLKITTVGDSFSRTWLDLFKSDTFSGAGKYKFNVDINGELAKDLHIAITNSKISMGGENVIISGTYASSKGGAAKADFDISANTITLGGSERRTPSGGVGRHWSQDKIDLSGVTDLKGSLNINIKKLIKDNLKFDNLKSKIVANNGMLTLENFSALFDGGLLEASGSLSSKGNQPMNLKAKVKNAQLSNFISSKTYKITQGTIDLNLNLKSQGKSQLAYMQNLSGNVDLNSINGKVSGFNLQKAKEAVARVKSIDSLLGVLDVSFSGGETVYKHIIAKADIENGIARLKECNVDATDAKATVTGTVNLPEYTLDTLVNVDVMLKNVPPFTVKLYGSLDNPSHKLDTGALQQHLLQNVLKGALEKGIKKLGGDKGIDASNPEALIKGLLGGLGKKKN